MFVYLFSSFSFLFICILNLLDLKFVSCGEHIIWTCFSIQFDHLCLLTGLFNPFTFNVTIFFKYLFIFFNGFFVKFRGALLVVSLGLILHILTSKISFRYSHFSGIKLLLWTSLCIGFCYTEWYIYMCYKPNNVIQCNYIILYNLSFKDAKRRKENSSYIFLAFIKLDFLLLISGSLWILPVDSSYHL